MEQQHITREKSQFFERLKNCKYRESFIRASINVNLPSQIRALRLRQKMTQNEFAAQAGMKQSRVSAMEKPGGTRFNIETLVRVAATLGVGLIVRFVPISEMLAWENGFSQDKYDVVRFDSDCRLRCTIQWSDRGVTPNIDWEFKISDQTMRALPQNVDVPSATSNPIENTSTATVQPFQF